MDARAQQAEIDALLEELLARLPESSTGVIHLVQDIEAHGYVELALSVLARAVAVCPGGVLTREYAIRCFHAGDLHEAGLHMQNYIQHHPEDGDGWIWLARIYAPSGDQARVRYCLDAARKRRVRGMQVALWEERLLTTPQEPMDFDVTEQRPIPSPHHPSAAEMSREVTHNIYRPAAPYDSGLVLATIKAVLKDPARGNTDPFLAAYENDPTFKEDDLSFDKTSSDILNKDAASAPPLHGTPKFKDDPTQLKVLSNAEWTHEPNEGQARAASTPPLPPLSSTGPELELEDIHKPAPAPTRTPAPAPTRTPAPSSTTPPAPAPTAAFETPKSSKSRWAKRIVILGLLGVIVLLVGGWAGAYHTQHERLTEAIGEIEGHLLTDAYQDHLQALKLAENALEETRVLPPALDAIVFESLPMFPGKDVGQLRGYIEGRIVELAALIEWRFETDGSRQAATLVESLVIEEAAAQVAWIYLNLIQGANEEALAIAKQAFERNPRHRPSQQALAEALLATKADDTVEGLVRLLNTHTPLTPRRLLLAMKLEHRGEPHEKLVENLDKFIRAEGSELLDARLTLGELLEKDDEALSGLLTTLGEEVANSAYSDYERARIQHTLGVLSLKTDDKPGAREHFAQALELAPTRQDLYPKLVDLDIEEGRYEEALAVLATMEKHLGQSSATGLLERRARIALLTGNTAEALEFVRAIKSPTAKSQWLRGLIHLEFGAPDAARRAFEAASQDKGTPATQAFALYARSARGDDKERTASQLGELCKAYGGDVDVLRACALTALYEAETASTRAQRKQALEQARAHLASALLIHPEDVFLQYDLCAVEIARGDREKAHQVCSEARQTHPGHTSRALLLVELRLREGRYSEALDTLAEIAELHRDPQDFQLSALRIEALTGLRRFEDAHTTLESWVGSDQAKTFEYAMLKGRLDFARHDYGKAKENFERALTIRSDDVKARVWFGHTLVRLEENDEADKLLRELLSVPVWGAQAWFALGELRRRQGRFSDATTNFARAREFLGERIQPGVIEVLIDVELARSWQTRFNADHPRVAQFLEAARAHGEAEIAELLLAEGNMHFGKRRRDLPRARRALEKATELDPLLCESWKVLRQVYQAQRARPRELRELRDRTPASCS